MNNFWIRDLHNKLDFCRRNLDNATNRNRVISNLRLINNELSWENKRNSQVEAGIDFEIYDPLKLDPAFMDIAENYLNRLNRYYIQLYNSANNAKDQIILGYYQTNDGREQFILERENHHNESLSELLRNAREVTRIVEYNERLYQRSDPIYRDPEGRFIKAHFYAPQKQLF